MRPKGRNIQSEREREKKSHVSMSRSNLSINKEHVNRMRDVMRTENGEFVRARGNDFTRPSALPEGRRGVQIESHCLVRIAGHMLKNVNAASRNGQRKPLI